MEPFLFGQFRQFVAHAGDVLRIEALAAIGHSQDP
jgi:hypothetical protein